MRRYRVSCGSFLDIVPHGGITHKSGYITGLTIYTEVSLFKDGNEIFFCDDENGQISMDGLFECIPGLGLCLDETFMLSVNRDAEFGYEIITHDTVKANGFSLKFRTEGGCKWINDGEDGYPEQISAKELINILMRNIDHFDIPCNKSARTGIRKANIVKNC